LRISGLFADLQQSLPDIANNRPDIILFDGALPGGLVSIGQIRSVAPDIPVVVIAVAENPAEVIAWAEAGAAGYIPRTAGLVDIVPFLVDIRRGEQRCSPSVAAGLLHRLWNIGPIHRGHHEPAASPVLTGREAQIAWMIVSGMSNKEIARHLDIGVATAKTHVHHLLGKLNLQRRGQAATWMREHHDRYLY
jgi:DNA-binding NarL/FixJ family response regulator